VTLAMTVAAMWTVLSFLLAVAVGHTLRVLDRPVTILPPTERW